MTREDEITLAISKMVAKILGGKDVPKEIDRCVKEIMVEKLPEIGMEEIELKANGKKATYQSDIRNVSYKLDGVPIQAEVPENWTLCQIFHFMEGAISPE